MKARLIAAYFAAAALSVPAVAYSADTEKDAMPTDTMSKETTPKDTMSRDAAAPKKEGGIVSDAMITTKIKAEFAKDKKPVPWVRVYQLPGYVWFSHKVHMKKGACETCHGPVAERDVLTREKPITMTACKACHD